jgi:hypothetical protein
MSFPTDDSKLEAKHLIQKFNNGPKDRYHVWRRRVEFALRDIDLWGLVTREKKNPVYQELVPNPAPNAGPANIRKIFLIHKVEKTLQYLNQYRNGKRAKKQQLPY